MFHPYAGVTGIRFDGSTQAMCLELSAQKKLGSPWNRCNARRGRVQCQGD